MFVPVWFVSLSTRSSSSNHAIAMVSFSLEAESSPLYTPHQVGFLDSWQFPTSQGQGYLLASLSWHRAKLRGEALREWMI